MLQINNFHMTLEHLSWIVQVFQTGIWEPHCSNLKIFFDFLCKSYLGFSSWYPCSLLFSFHKKKTAKKSSSLLWSPAECKFLAGLSSPHPAATSQSEDEDDDEEDDDQEEDDEDGDEDDDDDDA